tara:strand:- start:310 stop:537 length:228 start_codon:yes stop_codon:yes gene_type:complete
MKRKIKIHLFQTNPEYNLIHQDLLKQERVWANTGQYFMAKECESRAARLLNEDISEINNPIPTQNLQCPTRKQNY